MDEPAEEPIMGAPQTHDEEEVKNILKMVTMVVMMIIVKMMMIPVELLLQHCRIFPCLLMIIIMKQQIVATI